VNSLSDIGDDILLKRCTKGDWQAWESLVTQYGRRLRELIKRLLGRDHYAETDDLFIETWWILLKDDYRVLRRYNQSEGTFAAYLLGIGRNAVRNSKRRGGLSRKRQVSMSHFSPDRFRTLDMHVKEITEELESQATNAEKRFLLRALLQPPGFEVPYSDANRRTLTQRLLDKAWPLLYGAEVSRPHRRNYACTKDAIPGRSRKHQRKKARISRKTSVTKQSFGDKE